MNLPDERGYFETFGGKFVPETLMYALEELEREYKRQKKIENFRKNLNTTCGNMSAVLHPSTLRKGLQSM